MRIRGAVLEQIGAPTPFAQSRPIVVSELDLADPAPGELLVRIEAAGLCHSDLSVVDGNRVRPVPMLLGHEAAGIVEAVGSDDSDIAVGQRVVMTFLPRCGQCAGCATDGRTPCEPGSMANNAGELLNGGRRLLRDGVEVHHHLGVSAFATHAVVDRHSVVPVDADVPPEVAAILGCAVLTGGGALLNSAKPGPSDRIMVVGLGGVGMAAVLVAAALRAGADGEVIAVDTVPEKLKTALELGATAAYTPQEVAEQNIQAEAVIEAAGNIRAFETAVAATAGRRHHRHRRPARPRRPSQHLSARAGRAGPRHRRQLPGFGRARPRHPGVRADVAGGPTAGGTPGVLTHQARGHQRRDGRTGRRARPAADRRPRLNGNEIEAVSRPSG